MKKTYITPKMLIANVETAPLCLSAVDGPATSNTVLSKRRGGCTEDDVFYDDFDEE